MERIQNEEQYQQVMERIGVIFDAEYGTAEGEELDKLVDLVVEYEETMAQEKEEN